MLNILLARKYAVAMFELAQEDDKLLVYGKELDEIASLFHTIPDLLSYMTNPQIQPAAKKELLNKILTEDTHLPVKHFLLLLIDKHRIGLLPDIVHEYELQAYDFLNIALAYVTSARELSQAQEQALCKKLEQVTGKKIKMKKRIDPSIIGGLIVKVGDKLIDGSVTGQLKSLETQLLAN